MVYRVTVLQFQRKFKEATEEMERVLKFDVAKFGQDYPVKREMIEALENLGRAFALWGQVLMLGGAPEKLLGKARELLEKSIALKPDLYLSQFLLARVLMKQKKWSEALRPADAAVRLEPEFANAWEIRAEIRFQLALPKPTEEQLRECERDLNEGLRVHPDAATIRSTRATIREWLHDWDGAADDSLAMLTRWKDHWLSDEAHGTLRRAASSTSRPETLLARLESVPPEFEKSKHVWSLWWSRSKLHSRLNDHEGALARAVQGFAAAVGAETVGRLRESAGDLARAKGLDAVSLAVASQKESVRGHALAGAAAAFARANEWASCEQAAGRAIDVDASNAAAWRWRAAARSVFGKPQEARACYEQALKLDPSLEREIRPELEALPR
jgi:tetratricopeptide (TPR) repeat protein